ncbi:MAG TPA: HEAT repeat domain-containing protein, partial [Geobacteraceae bacterium]
EKIRGIYSAIPETVQQQPMIVPQHIFTITEEETAWLREARETDEQRKPLEEVINILTAILRGAKDARTFGDFVVIMVKLTGNVILAGEMVHALKMIRFLHELAASESVPPEQRRMISTAMSKILNERTVKVLQKTIDTTDALSFEDLRELLRVFGAASLGPMCELLGLVEKMKMRRIILEVLVEIGKENPDAFTPYLSDQRWYLVRNMVFVLTRLGRPVPLDSVVRLIGHREPRVRREVLTFLDHYPDPKAKTYLLKFLRDDSSAVRIRALQALGRSKLPMALKQIAAITEAEDFDELSLAEKKAVYEALGELGGEQSVPMLRNLLLKKFWFKKSKERDSVTCAVAGLVKTRTASAMAVLEEAQGAVKGDELRQLVAEGLETLTAERSKAAAEKRSR